MHIPYSVPIAKQIYQHSTVSYPKNKNATLRGNRLHISCSYSRTRFPLVVVSYLKKKRSTAMLGDNRQHIFCSYSWTKLPGCMGFDSIYSVLTAQHDYHQYPTWGTKRYSDAGRDSTPHILFIQPKKNYHQYPTRRTKLPPCIKEQDFHWYPTWRTKLPRWARIDFTYSVYIQPNKVTTGILP
jgi:hypothetical protein